MFSRTRIDHHGLQQRGAAPKLHVCLLPGHAAVLRLEASSELHAEIGDTSDFSCEILFRADVDPLDLDAIEVVQDLRIDDVIELPVMRSVERVVVRVVKRHGQVPDVMSAEGESIFPVFPGGNDSRREARMTP
jgi:hypothetical protein